MTQNQTPTSAEREHAQNLLNFINDSPSPWHAVETSQKRLEAAGYTQLHEADRWPRLNEDHGYYVIRGGSSLIAFRPGAMHPAESGFMIVGAHTDSPGLRIKPHGQSTEGRLIRLGVEIYGSPVIATFADRDLSFSGRISIKDPEGRILTRLLHFKEALVRLPSLAIHLNRGVNEDGLKFNKQSEVPLLFGQAWDGATGLQALRHLISESLSVEDASILGFELNVHEVHSGQFWGARQEFISTGRIDNLSSCHAALGALLDARAGNATKLIGFFDHEEVGSESHQGAAGSFLSKVLGRISGPDPESLDRALARSLFLSADAAHAYHPSFPSAYEPLHQVHVNHGPVIKFNSNHRYATEGPQAALLADLAQSLGLNIQTYVHRNDLGCGSTIGPIASARLGIPTIDLGIPMWSMHSIRESAGVCDALSLKILLQAALSGA